MVTARAKGLRPRVVIGRHALAQCPDPGRDLYRYPLRRAAWRGGDYRDGFRPPGNRSVRRRARFRSGTCHFEGTVIFVGIVTVLANLSSISSTSSSTLGSGRFMMAPPPRRWPPPIPRSAQPRIEAPRWFAPSQLDGMFGAVLLPPPDPLGGLRAPAPDVVRPRQDLFQERLLPPNSTILSGPTRWGATCWRASSTALAFRCGPVFLSSRSAPLGTMLGVVAGFYRRWVDMAIMRFADLWMAMPGILLAMVFIFTLGRA